jgi:hypothetical protein
VCWAPAQKNSCLENKNRGIDITLALVGVVALRQGDIAAARDALRRTLSEAEAQLVGAAKAYATAYVKELALAGLALCQDAAYVTAAAKAYREARHQRRSGDHHRRIT